MSLSCKQIERYLSALQYYINTYHYGPRAYQLASYVSASLATTRRTLWQLAKLGLVQKIGDGWYLVEDVDGSENQH